MAASTTTPAQLELINSLSQDEIPIKLRCAICSKLAINAFRLPCCEQAICESCQSILPSTCPVCEHSPVAAADCKPNKSLRTTIKVFLRTEEKKREALRQKEEKTTPPDTPIQPDAPPMETAAPTEPAGESEMPNDTQVEGKGSEVMSAEQPEETNGTEQSAQAQQDIPQPSIEEIAPGQESLSDAVAKKEGVTNAENGDADTAKDVNGEHNDVQGQASDFGLDPTAAGGFPAMGFGGDFSQMQMMMALQNGMAPGAFGNFPMMGMPGMPGMGMDPMTMQQMFMNGGFGGTGMNGMNMGMGMGGFDGGVGAGFNNWNGQQSWNFGQDNFNHQNAMGAGDYGSNNSGYPSHTSGYNQGNYGRTNHFNDYSSYPSHGFRGRGRGRGGFARGGGYGHNSNDAYSQQQYQQQTGAGQQYGSNEAGSVPKGPKADAVAGDVDEFGREIRQKSEVKKDISEDVPAKQVEDEDTTQQAGADVAVEGGPIMESAAEIVPTEDQQVAEDENVPMPIQTLEEMNAYAQNGGHSADGYGLTRGGFGQGHFRGGRGGNFSMQPPIVKPVDVPINAPTGPKAMREGLPNTSLANLRGRGYSALGGPSSRTAASVSVPPEPSEKDLQERERNESVSKDRVQDRSRSKSRDRRRSRSRSRSRSREKRHRRRHRSTSLSEDEKETERRRERRKERRRRREEEGYDEDRGELVINEEKDDKVEERSRSITPSESRRSSHRSRRERDDYRDRDRDRDRKRDSDREHKSSSHKHRSHRSHREERDRSRSRDRDHKHRHSRHHSEALEDKTAEVNNEPVRSPIDTQEASRRPSIISNGLEIKGASARRKVEEIVIPTGPRQDRTRDREKESRNYSDRRSSHHESSRSGREKENGKTSTKSSAPPTPTIKDPHELEREARNRERLLKEAQRIAGLTAGMAGRKRSRDDGVQDDSSRKGRKKGRRGGAVVDENEEARLARMEAERDGARWG